MQLLNIYHEMNRTQEIIYDLLYSEENQLIFKISDLCSHIEDYSYLTNGIISNVNRGDVYIIEDSIIVDNDDVYWKLKVKRN